MSGEKSAAGGKDTDTRAAGDALPTTSPAQQPKLSWKWSLLILVLFIASLAKFVQIIAGEITKPASGSPRAGLLVSREHVKEANRILSENPLIDGHNDFAMLVRYLYKNRIYDPKFKKEWEKGGLPGHVDLPSIQRGKSGGAFWSAFLPCPADVDDFSDENYAPIVKATLEQLDLLRRLGEEYPKYFTSPATADEALSNFKNGNFIAPYIIEGLHQIGNSLSTLRLYYALGVRYATLTWNCHNKYADAALITMRDGTAKAKPLHHGVSKEGERLIKEMNRMGMIVDLSHVSAETQVDVLSGKGSWKGSIAPPIFSHSSAYAVCPHPRNVQDHVLRLVKERKSVVMVNFSPGFVSCKASDGEDGLPEFDEENNTLMQVVRHIMHIGEYIGYDYVGIGSDYDGMETTPKGLENVSKFPLLFAALLKEGVSSEDCIKIAGGNVLRVWREVGEVAAKMQKDGVKPEEDEIKVPGLPDAGAETASALQAASQQKKGKGRR